jgi:hypothetical protein
VQELAGVPVGAALRRLVPPGVIPQPAREAVARRVGQVAGVAFAVPVEEGLDPALLLRQAGRVGGVPATVGEDPARAPTVVEVAPVLVPVEGPQPFPAVLRSQWKVRSPSPLYFAVSRAAPVSRTSRSLSSPSQ